MIPINKTLSVLPAIALAALIASPALKGQEQFTVKKFVELPMMGHGVLSPSGRFLAYQVTRRDIGKNTYIQQIHLVELSEHGAIKTDKKLTKKPGSSWAPLWRPGGGLVFSSSRGGKSGLWLTKMDGSDPKKILSGSASSPAFSKDGSRLAFLAPPKKDPARRSFGKDPEVRNYVEDITTWPQLWVLDMKTLKKRQITDGSSYIYQFDWHPSGKKLVFTFDTNGSEGLTEDHGMGIIDLSGKVKILGTGPVKYSFPKWNPLGDKIAFFRDRSEEYDVYLTIKDLFVMDPAGKSEPFNLTHKWHGNPTGRLSSPMEPPHWSVDEKWLWFSGAERASLNVYRVNSDGSGSVQALTNIKGEIGNLSFDRDFKNLAFSWTDFIHPSDIFISSIDWLSKGDFMPIQVTNIRQKVEKYKFRMPKRLLWKSKDGTEVEGFLFLPRDYKKGKAVPIMFDAHGGPAFRWGNAFSYRYMWHVFAHEGFGSLIFNPRGSTAYGLKHQQGNYQGFGIGDFQDLMAAVDMLIAKGITKEDRIGMTGYSYGGYMTNLAISRTKRFKVAVTIAGAFNFASAMGQSNSILPRAYYKPLVSKDNMLRMFKHSPVSRAMNITTPTLIIHGKKDTAVHHMQAIEMFNTLQLCGAESKLILYPGEGHGINQPKHMLHYLEESVKWLKKHLPGWKEALGR